MPVSVKRISQKGFTLVELLIVVAIIGVLSTIGVPTFRKMIQKAKKSEAKVNLGGLYTAENAFFSEYEVYGNAIDRIGFETDGQNLIYVIGFMATDCKDIAVAPVTAAAKPLSSAMNSAYSDYATSTLTKTGNNVLTKCSVPPAAATTASFPGRTNAPDVYPAATDPNQFFAWAIGVVSPNVSTTAPTDGRTDIWGIDNTRKLANLQDGVGKKD